MGRTLGFRHSAVGHWDMSGISPAFLGHCDGKDSGILGTLQWDAWDVSGMSPAFLGL